MQYRSPLITGLLIGATLGVDAVAWTWVATSSWSDTLDAFTLGLLFAQVGVLCAWAILPQRAVGWRWVAPFLGGLVGATLYSLAAAKVVPTDSLQDFFLPIVGLCLIYAAGAMLALWALRPTRLLRADTCRPDMPAWQFSVWHLLVLMTAGSLLLALMVRTEAFANSTGASIIALTVLCSVMLLVAVTAVCRTAWHWVLRLAACLAAALLLGGACNLAYDIFSMEYDFVTHFLAQAIVLFIWLELGPILPRDADAAANTSEPASRE
jgi:hypothetical protein